MGRTSVIAISMFVFLVLGNMAIVILSGAQALSAGGMPGFLVGKGWWLLFMPVVWAGVAKLVGRASPAGLGQLHVIGVLLAAGIIGVYGATIFFL